MQMFRKLVAGILLVSCGMVQAQTAGSVSSAKPAKTKTVRPKSQEEVLLQQLNDNFRKLDQMNEKLDDLQKKYDALEKRVGTRDAELEQTKKDAAAAQAAASDAKLAAGPDGAAVKKMEEEVTSLRDDSTSLSTKVDATEQATKKLEHPDSLHFMGVDLIPGGFLAAETVDRQRATGSDVNTPFNQIPFAGQTAGGTSEFNATARQSRLSLLIEGKRSSATLRGYFEADFLGAGSTSNNNQSNSYPFRLRQAWAQAELNNGWSVTGGQMWSLATEYRHGLSNLSESIPLTIDSQYNVGYVWARQYGFRAVKRIGDHLWVGGSVEEAQTLNIGGHNLPTIVYQEPGTAAGATNPLANYSFNYAPDLLAKVAYETNWGHFEVFGIGRFFRDRVFPNGPLPPGALQPPTVSALGAYTAKTEGGGIGANARVALFSKRLDLGAHALVGNGIGRYGSSGLPDATAHPDGSLELLPGGSALGSAEWHVTPRFDIYAYYGGDYAKRAWYASGYTDTTVGPTLGQPILTGYGAPTNIVSGCYMEVLPVSSPNGGGNVTGAATNCNADTRNLQEGTFGYWFRFYRGVHGTLSQGIQYSYAVRHTWQGIGDLNNNIPNSPKAIDNMWFTSFRYYLPQREGK